MMQNSIIISDWVKREGDSSSYSGNRMQCMGCCESVAIGSECIRHVTLGLPILIPSVWDGLKKFILNINPDYTPRTYIRDWTLMVYNAFNCMNIGGERFISLYTVADLNKEKFRDIDPNISIRKKEELTFFSYNYASPVEGLMNDDIIGIEVDSSALREYFGYRYYDKSSLKNPSGAAYARKVQFPHTAMRFMWSNASNVAMIALKLKQLNSNIDPFYLLQMGWNIRGKSLGQWTADYGQLLGNAESIISKPDFMKAFLDPKCETVMGHFKVSVDPLVKLVTDVSANGNPVIPSLNIKTLDGILNLKDNTITNQIEEMIRIIEDEKKTNAVKIAFKFNKVIFRATVVKVKYSGYKKKGVNIDRILFKDEEGTILSIAEKSKLIEIL